MIRFIAQSIIKFDAPSRTITYSSFTPFPIVKALYKVSKNITLSKTSTPVHAIAATGSLSYYDHLVIYNPVTYIDPYGKRDQSYRTKGRTACRIGHIPYMRRVLGTSYKRGYNWDRFTPGFTT